MAGVIQFDRNAVLAGAAEAFWRKGYDATSVAELEAATTLGRGSLYNAFGDKRGLFLAALRHYADTVAAPARAHLEAEDAREGVRAMLTAIVERMDEPERPRGCLLTNTCLAASGAPDVEAFVRAAFGGMQEALEAAVARARRAGQVSETADPRALARFYSAVAQSLGVMHRAGAGREALEDVVEIALAAWPSGAASAAISGDPRGPGAASDQSASN